MSEGNFTIPTRVYLEPEQREKLLLLIRERNLDLPELLTELLASFLDHLPEYEQASTPAADESDSDVQLRQRRAEIRRLRARVVAGEDTTHAWLGEYIADLESEIDRLEAEQ
jgi:uncharacterized small protein (DUF1192 family)